MPIAAVSAVASDSEASKLASSGSSETWTTSPVSSKATIWTTKAWTSVGLIWVGESNGRSERPVESDVAVSATLSTQNPSKTTPPSVT